MNLGGVYEIVCVPTGKRYVGSAARSMRRRWQKHRSLLGLGQHHSRPLQNAWKKYGADAFEFRVLLICRPEDAVFFEQRSIDMLRPTFNVNPTAASVLGLKRGAQSEAHRRALGEAKKRRWAEGAYATRAPRSDAHKHLVYGELLTLREIAVKYGLKWGTLCWRLRHAVTGDALVTPLKSGGGGRRASW